MNIFLDQNLNAVVKVDGAVENAFNMGMVVIEGNSSSGGYYMDGGFEGEIKDSENTSSGTLLSNWFFVGGVSGGVFLISVIFGIILAKKRIKKGIDIYEN